ncbi:hypothetical protein TNCV_349251 [Trichonephila clavipes]|nr:hypothetical protein TNCV_349251 [Trichonephila clavipes]
MAKHKPRKSAPTEYTNDDEDRLMYDVEEELEPDPTDKFVLKECPTNFPREYLRSLSPTRFKKIYPLCRGKICMQVRPDGAFIYRKTDLRERRKLGTGVPVVI